MPIPLKLIGIESGNLLMNSTVAIVSAVNGELIFVYLIYGAASKAASYVVRSGLLYYLLQFQILSVAKI